MSPGLATDHAAVRPRVAGVREQQILDAALEALADVGYDRLTMDAVAARARASKATLYRRWRTKADLVVEALTSQKEAPMLPDTGSLRGDLLATYCGLGGLTDRRQLAVFASVVTAISRNEEFAEAFRRDFVAPKAAIATAIFERARERGEIPADADIALLAPALPGIVLHRLFLMGERPTSGLVERVVDQIILPAARYSPSGVPDRPQKAHT